MFSDPEDEKPNISSLIQPRGISPEPTSTWKERHPAVLSDFERDLRERRKRLAEAQARRAEEERERIEEEEGREPAILKERERRRKAQFEEDGEGQGGSEIGKKKRKKNQIANQPSVREKQVEGLKQKKKVTEDQGQGQPRQLSDKTLKKSSTSVGQHHRAETNLDLLVRLQVDLSGGPNLPPENYWSWDGLYNIMRHIKNFVPGPIYRQFEREAAMERLVCLPETGLLALRHGTFPGGVLWYLPNANQGLAKDITYFHDLAPLSYDIEKERKRYTIWTYNERVSHPWWKFKVKPSLEMLRNTLKWVWFHNHHNDPRLPKVSIATVLQVKNRWPDFFDYIYTLSFIPLIRQILKLECSRQLANFERRQQILNHVFDFRKDPSSNNPEQLADVEILINHFQTNVQGLNKERMQALVANYLISEGNAICMFESVKKRLLDDSEQNAWMKCMDGWEVDLHESEGWDKEWWARDLLSVKMV